MNLVVDTSVLFSFFRETSVRKIIVDSELLGLELFAPEYAFMELRRNELKLAKYSKASGRELEFIFSALSSFIEEVPERAFHEFMLMGKKASPDKKDAPFFALALKLNAWLWSAEPGLKRQTAVRVFSTSDLMKLLSL